MDGRRMGERRWMDGFFARGWRGKSSIVWRKWRREGGLAACALASSLNVFKVRQSLIAWDRGISCSEV
ncbi:hypothetical protein CBR_g72676 [Chara braunii]|uniref:Uncharacterized protein n=1 Tax=Chara braunii TaxID=69332 RepID=A0A388KA76_CHABU|nr:hypothetical protein CBR_g72676 [Chara braunii]|eukprot:GBG66921.1 hypothetical protein CBR_g72676 [Chara braunii]